MGIKETGEYKNISLVLLNELHEGSVGVSSKERLMFQSKVIIHLCCKKALTASDRGQRMAEDRPVDPNVVFFHFCA